MGEWLVKALIFGIIAWIGWSLLQPRYVFVIRINRGEPSLRKGRVKTVFLESVAAVCHECGIVRGWIGGVQRGRRIALRFSNNFPPGSQQMLRNQWTLPD